MTLMLAAAAAVSVALAAALAPVAGFDFVLWDDPRILNFVAARDTGFPSRAAWLLSPGATGMTSPVAVGIWGLFADTIGMTPGALHLLTISLHMVNVALVALLCRAVLGLIWEDGAAPWSVPAWTASICLAGLWGLHPSRAEVVAWVAAMPHALSTALGLSAVLLFLRSLATEGTRRGAFLAGSAACYLAAVLAHPQVVPLAVVMVLLDRAPGLGRRPAPGRPWWREPSLLFHAFSLAVAAWGLGMGLALRSGNAVAPSDAPPEAITGPYLFLQLTKYAGFAGEFSLIHAWFPARPSLIYPAYDLGAWRAPLFLLGLGGLGAWFVVALRQARRGSAGLLVALLAHLAYALPASGPFLTQYVRSDRYTYAITILPVVLGAAALFRLLRRPGHAAFGRRALLVAAALAASGAACIGLTQSLTKWRSTVPLMEDLISSGPDTEWRLFAALRIATYWGEVSNHQQARAALARLVEIPDGPRDERIVQAVEFVANEGQCAEAALLLGLHAEELAAGQAGFCQHFVQLCHESVRQGVGQPTPAAGPER